MKHRVWAIAVLIAILLLSMSLAQVSANRPDAQALVRIAWHDRDDAAKLEAAGVPVYAHLVGDDGPYLLAGTAPGARQELQIQGMNVSILDADMNGATYYLVYAMPNRPQLDWQDYGRLLHDDGTQALLRMTPKEAARLAEMGAQLRLLSLDPKPLRPVSSPTIPTDIQPDPSIQEMIDAVDSGTVMSYTGDLSGENQVQIGGSPYTIATRHTASNWPINQATQFAAEHLESLGLNVEYHNWSSSGYSNRNVIGELTGEANPDDVFIICAHLDDMPSGMIAPGADDNASGSVAVLVAADILTQYQWDCTLRFAFWTGEEQGLLGSQRYAQRAYSNGENIVGVLNLDMIAWDEEGGPDIDLHATSTIPASVDLANLFADVVDAYNLDLTPRVVRNGLGASDHAAFWDYGYTSILGIEDYMGGDFNAYYHTTNDKVQYLNKFYFSDFVRASVGTFAHMSNCLVRPHSYYLPLVTRDAIESSLR